MGEANETMAASLDTAHLGQAVRSYPYTAQPNVVVADQYGRLNIHTLNASTNTPPNAYTMTKLDSAPTSTHAAAFDVSVPLVPPSRPPGLPIPPPGQNVHRYLAPLASSSPARSPSASQATRLDPHFSSTRSFDLDAFTHDATTEPDEQRDTACLKSVATVEIPLSLAPPALHARTNPYVDLGAHLRYYGMEAEAREFTASQTTCDFVLTAFLTMYAAPGGASAAAVSNAGEALMMELEHTVSAREGELQAQLSALAANCTARPGAMYLPLELHLSWRHPHSGAPTGALPLLPSHFLAVCKRRATPLTNGVRVVETPCSLVPIHWIVYVLQCAHLPLPLHSTGGVPVLECPVPYPQHWALIHRWLYTRDPGKLLAALLPLHVLRALHASNRAAPVPTAVSALASLALPMLSSLLLKIRATWHNGRVLGIYADTFWATLRRAWDLAVCAVVVRKGRMAMTRKEVHSA